MNERLNKHAGVLALVAFVLALIAAVGGVASATGVFVTSRQIKNGTILSQDIHNNAVKSADLKNNTVSSTDLTNNGVGSADIAPAAVESEALSLPEAEQIEQNTETGREVAQGDGFTKIDDVGAYTKETAESVLEVQWSGTATERLTSGGEPKTTFCVYQVRVDGQPSEPTSNGEAVLGGGSMAAAAEGEVTADVLFNGLGAGAHSIEIWARTSGSGIGAFCGVGADNLGIGQTFVVSEQVT